MKTHPNPDFMKAALREASKNLKTMDGGPFGACIVKNGRIIGLGRNTVLKNDATCHAEVNAIRLASKKLRKHDLSGCVIYSTTEPCPMCFSAIHWSRIGKIFYGTSTSDAKKIGFNELNISDKELVRIGKSKIKLYPKICLKECRELFQKWDKMPGKVLY